MSTLEKQTGFEDYEYNRYLANYYDAATWVAEALDGAMTTKFDFYFDGQELWSEDGRCIRDIFNDAVIEAERIAKYDPRLSFEVRRRMLELEEYKLMILMAKGHLPNTMLVISDFPTEVNRLGESVAGYNFKRQQTMQRAIFCRGDRVTVVSQSLDRSDRDGLEAIYGLFNQRPMSGELLGQRISIELDDDEQDRLIGHTTRVYDNKLQEKTGLEYYAGRTPVEMISTYDFVRLQRDLLHSFATTTLLSDPTELQLYDLAAAINGRFKKRHQIGRAFHIVEVYTPEQEMLIAGMKARLNGESYDGCGISIGPFGSDSGLNENLDNAGYGNKSDMKCVKCPFCKKTVDAIVTSKKICCPECKTEVNRTNNKPKLVLAA